MLYRLSRICILTMTFSSVFLMASPDENIVTLSKHVGMLRKICKDDCGKRFIDIVSFLDDNASVSYDHELIRLALKKIGVIGSVGPLIECWDLFQNQYRFLEEDNFIREYSVILFFVYKNIIERYSVSRVSLTDIIRLSAQIASLPIDQVLFALERCYQQFMVIMREYGLQPGISLSVWSRQYWWVPPVVLLSTLYSIAVHFLLRGRQSLPSWSGGGWQNPGANDSLNLDDLINHMGTNDPGV